MVEPESFVRVIEAFVNHLDLDSFDFTHHKLNKEGRPDFHPANMLKKYLYGYHNGIRSSRKLEHPCKVNIEMKWLINEQQPNFKTIASFRKNNPKSFKEVFRYFVFILKEWKLIN
jgi:transposase